MSNSQSRSENGASTVWQIVGRLVAAAVVLAITAFFTPGFSINNIWTLIIAAVVLMISFIAAAFKHTLNLSTCRKTYAAAFRIMEFSANRYSASEKSIADKERLLQANILAEEIVSFMLE